MDAIKAGRKAAKDRKKRQKTAIVGDLQPLEDTLPTLELLLKDSTPSRIVEEERYRMYKLLYFYF